MLHAAAGAAILALERRSWQERRWRLAALVLTAALLPDLDLLAGLLLRDPNRFHADFTHTLGFALLVAPVFGLAAGAKRLRAGILCFAASFAHNALDALTSDAREPLGVSLFWPVTDARVSLSVLPGVRHGFDGATVSEFFREVFSLANLRTLGIEFVIGVLLVAASWAIGAAWHRRRARGPARSKSTGGANEPGVAGARPE